MSRTTPFVDLLCKRRSIRQFKQEPLSRDALDTLQEALLRAPTSRGKNPWNFIFIEDRSLLGKVSRAKYHGSTFLASAALGVIIYADETISDVWIEDCSIAAITLQYAAQDLNLGSCWVQIRNRSHDDNTSSEDYLKNLLGIEEKFKLLCVIGIGIPDEDKTGHRRDQLPEGKIKRL